MARHLDISKLGKATRRIESRGKVVRTGLPTVVPGRERQFRKFRALFLRTFPTCLYQLKGCTRTATVLDHYVPTSVAPGRARDIHNLVPCCRSCHQIVTDKFDAVGGIAGNTRLGKPDPRNREFRERVEYLSTMPEVARWLHNTLPDGFELGA